MSRKVSTSSIIISLVLLTFASVTALAQTPTVESFEVPTKGGNSLKGIIIKDKSQTATFGPEGGTIWSGNGASVTESEEAGASATDMSVIYTLDNGTQLRGIIIKDKSQTATFGPEGGTIWSGNGASATDMSEGSSQPQTIIFTDFAGTLRGVMVGDRGGNTGGGALGVMVSDRHILKSLILNNGMGLALNLNGIIIKDKAQTSDESGISEDSNEITLHGSDGSKVRGIIIKDKSQSVRGIIIKDKSETATFGPEGGTIWSGNGASATDMSEETGTTGDNGQLVMLVDDNGSFIGLLYLGEGQMPFRGYIFGSK